MTPYILPATANPIGIDAGVTYHVVVPITGATSVRVNPAPDFALSFSGQTLSVKFVSAAPLAPTSYQVTIVASNSDGTVSQTLNFRVSPNQISATSTKFAAISDGTADLRFAAVFPILLVNDVVFDSTGAHFYIVAVGTNTFRYSATSGGGPITPATIGTIYFNVAATSDTSTDLWVGDTSSLRINAPINIDFDSADGTALESALAGNLFVKSITDAYHIKVSATSGGSAIAPTVIANTLGKVIVLGQSSSGIRTVPDINSAATAAAAKNAPFSYLLASDVLVDSFAVEGLPDRLTFSGSIISGTAPDLNAAYAITLIANKGDGSATPARSFRRYLILTVGSGGALGRTAESIFTWRI